MKRLIILICLLMSYCGFAQEEMIDMVTEFEDFYLFEAFELIDTLLFVASHYGLSVWSYNEENPENPPYEVIRYPTLGICEALVVSDTVCYLADGYNGLIVLSIADYQNIYQIGHCPDATKGQYILKKDNILYMACGQNGLRTIDISDPFNPVLLQSYSRYLCEDIRIVNEILYSVSDYSRNIFLYDISDPSNIQEVNRYEVEDDPNGIEIHDNLLFTLADDSFTILSIEDPRNIEVVFASQHRYGMGVIMNAIRYFNGYIYMGRNCIWDVRNPREARIIEGSHDYGAAYLELGENVSYVSSTASPRRGRDLMIYDLHNLDPRELLHWHPAAYGLSDVFIRDNILYVSSRYKYGSKFEIYNINNINDPIKIGGIDSTQGNTGSIGYNDIYIHADLAILWEHDIRDSLYIFSVEDVERPQLIRGISRLSIMDLVADGDYLYLGCDGPGAPAGLNIISIENPNNPELVWSLRADVPGFFQVYGVALTENYAISVSYNRGGEWEQNFRIWDRSNPEDLQLVGSRTVEGYYASISILDDYAYVTGIIDRGCLLSVVSIEDPENPELVNTSELPGFAEDSKIQDGFLYISFWNLGFGIFDLENPEQPELIAHYDTPVSLGLSNQLAVTDGYVLTPGIIYDCARVTGRWNVELSAESHDFGVVYLNADSTYQLTISNLAQQDVEILDISCDSAAFSVDFDEAFSIDPGEDANVNITFAPTERQLYNGQLTIQTERRDLTVDLTGTGVPLSTPDDDFQPFKFSIESAYPTPFNSTVNIGYTLDRTGNIRVSIFDLSGRETAVLHDGSMKAGNHSIIWNANNAASGIYVCRIESGSRAKMIKLTLIR